MNEAVWPEARKAPADVAGPSTSSRLMMAAHFDSHQVRTSMTMDDLCRQDDLHFYCGVWSSWGNSGNPMSQESEWHIPLWVSGCVNMLHTFNRRIPA